MSCGIASVNRTLSVLAAVWGLVPMVLVAPGMKAGAGEERALQSHHDSRRAEAPAAGPQESHAPCQLGEAQARVGWTPVNRGLGLMYGVEGNVLR